jgi:hypothetical protein
MLSSVDIGLSANHDKSAPKPSKGKILSSGVDPSTPQMISVVPTPAESMRLAYKEIASNVQSLYDKKMYEDVLKEWNKISNIGIHIVMVTIAALCMYDTNIVLYVIYCA